MQISEIPPAGIKENFSLLDYLPPDEQRAGKDWKAVPDVAGMRHQRVPMANIVAGTVHDDGARQHHFNRRLLFEKIVNGTKASRQILFVAVEIGENITLSAAINAADG